MKLNLPNKLTVIRFVLSPAILVAMLIDFPFHYAVALLIFLIASVTDYYDGKIARDQHLITDFGKFLDPIADKMITTAAFLGLTVLNIGYGIVWITFIVLLREFIVASVRMIAASKGKVIAANMWGKTKTVMQMVAIIATLSFLAVLDCSLLSLSDIAVFVIETVYSVLLWFSAVFTLISGITYITANKDFINSNK
ncbi:MAG: CDP-diacylglycerol--glycerol-3-phosphate 3-phosphatidyltransferase [Clostridia bacterium]|nr:CDP-diacylglycerol--glycerol-3-phosphate 3-phosphatidyltransferase [Clostridia bacterium]